MECGVVVDLVSEEEIELGGREAGGGLDSGDVDEAGRALGETVGVQVSDRLQRSHYDVYWLVGLDNAYS